MDTIIPPLVLSIKVAVLATLFAFVIGVLCAWWFSFYKTKMTEFISILVTIPLILPPTVLGYYLLLLLGRNSTFGSWVERITGSSIVFTWNAAVIAATIAALPLLIRPIQSAFESVDIDIIKASRLDGAGKLQELFYIILPLSFRGILGGVVLGFARAMGEFGATIMVAGNIPGKTQTLSIAIYDAVQANRMSDAHLMVLILSGSTFFFLFMIHRWIK